MKSACHGRLIYRDRMVQVRDARMSDARRLWRWANDPDTRRWSFSSNPIPWDEHVGWLQRVLADPDRLLLIGYDDWGEVGTVRFDVDEDQSKVSITIAPECRGEGIARPLLDAALRYAPRRRVTAQVFEDNGPSVSLFSGWTKTSSSAGVATFSIEA